MVPEIWRATDGMFCHFGPFFALLLSYSLSLSSLWKNGKSTWKYYNYTLVYHKQRSCDVLLVKYGVRQTKYFVIFDYFLPLYLSNNPKNQVFGKMKKKNKNKNKNPGDIIFLQMCTLNEDRMVYGSWDMECHIQNLFWFLTVFCPFTLLKRKKEKFWKEETNC